MAMSLPASQRSREVMRALSVEGWNEGSVNPDDPVSVVSAIRFLLEMSQQLEDHGNLPESVKSAESALFLRRANEERITKHLQPLITDGLLQRSSVDEAGELVLRCNNYAVSAFNEKRFEAAEFFLSKALFLTDVRSIGELNYFLSFEARRMRLRAATLNNLGCMEKRRGRMQHSLKYLRQAVELEVSVDDNSCGSPSTYMNLCTVLNELGQHHEAVGSAESAIAALEYQMMEQNKEQLSGSAIMLVVGLYNLGVSLERRGREGDAAKAHTAYKRSLLAARKYVVDPDCPTVDMAVAAIHRMRGTSTQRASQKEDLHLHQQRIPEDLPSSGGLLSVSAHSGSDAAVVAVRRTGEEASPHIRSSTVLPPEPLIHGARLSPLANVSHHSGLSFPTSRLQSVSRSEIVALVSTGSREQQAVVQPLTSHRGSNVSENVQRLENVSSPPRHTRERVSSAGVSRLSAEELPVHAQTFSAPFTTQKGSESTDSHVSGFGWPPRPLPPVQLPPVQLPQSQTEETSAQVQRLGQQWSSGSPRGAQPDPPVVTAQKRGFVSLVDEGGCPGGTPTTLVKKGSLPSLQGRSTASFHLAEPSNPMNSQHQQQQQPISPREASAKLISLTSQPISPREASAKLISITSQPFLPRETSAKTISITSQPILKPLHSASASVSGSIQGDLPKLSPVTSLAALAEFTQKGAGSKTSRVSVTEVSNPLGRRKFGSVSVQDSPSQSQSLSKRFMEKLSGPESQALEKHVQRAQLRQSMIKEAKKKSDGRRGSALARAKEREQKMISREEAKYDAEMADMLYEKLVVGMRAEELARCNRGATFIQKIWRGCMARTLVIRMIAAARKIQRIFRVYLVRILAARRLEMEYLAQEKAARDKKELDAATVIQARVRQFIKRLAIRRAYLALKMRRQHAARKIQRGYRAFLKRHEAYLASLMEIQRLEDERQRKLQMVAASSIQWVFRRYLKRREELRESHELQRRERAAATIQALMRGVLARAWFGYYKSYRREQEYKSAANQKRVIQLQAAARVQTSVKARRIKEGILLRRLLQQRLHVAAIKIQCMWRCRNAWIAAERLRAELGILNRRAARIQRWFQTRLTRRMFLEHLRKKRREEAAIQIQQWYHNAVIRAKEREMQRYHIKQVRDRIRARIQSHALLFLQAWWRCQISTLVVQSMRASFLRFTLYAEDFQRIGRGLAGRRSLGRYKHRLIREANERVKLRQQTLAACVIQRAWRCCMAKSAVEHLRMCAAASTQITKHYRGYLCRKELRRLREAKQLQKATRAAITIQRAARQFLRRIELVHMQKYYQKRLQKKLANMRREEAASTFQAIWRGRATRMALERERKALEALTVHVVRVQRAWRARIFRRKINIEVSKRSSTRIDRSRAALKLQCFWRKMLAAERVAQLRELNRIRQKVVIVLQRRWRLVLAKRELELRRLRRAEEQALEMFYMDKWEPMVTFVNATLRMRLSQGLIPNLIRKQLLMQLTDAERERFLKRHGAATKIQAIYRGHYERVYARWIRKQRAEEERRRQKREALESRCAAKIQCAFRCWRARRKTTALRTARREKELKTAIEQYTTINPQELVQQLFWVHESVTRRDFAKERVAFLEKREKAVITIQKTVRRWISKRRTQMIKLQAYQTRTVKTIQTFWKRYRARVMKCELEQKRQAAIIIQARIRGYFVRREWEMLRRVHGLERQRTVLEEDVYDHAVTVLQSFWRRIRAERYAAALLDQRQKKKVKDILDEAASCIQRAYRRRLKRLSSTQ